MSKICYLCGLPILGDNSGDHVVPKQFIKREQPKAKGFDYAGKLPSHETCNNQFGPEKYCQKALSLIPLLHDVKFLTHRDNPNIKILTIDSNCLTGFSLDELRFFKFIDVQNKDISEWSKESFFNDKPKTNVLEHALFVSLSVLAKSAAALLISRKLHYIPSNWRIIVSPWFDKGSILDFDELTGHTKPFEIGVKVWPKQANNGNWWMIYKAFEIVVFMFFWFSGIPSDIEEIKPFQSEARCFEFQSSQLIDLVNYDWKQI